MIQFKPLEWQEINLPGISLCLMGIISLPFSKDTFSGYMIFNKNLPGVSNTVYDVNKLNNNEKDEGEHGYKSLGHGETIELAKKIAQEDWEDTITSHFFELPFERIIDPL